jgi:iron(III) transport system ATP-binding protein
LTEHVLSLRAVSKVFDAPEGRVTAVDRVSFELRGAEFFTMLGPSGCGKTTTLRMIAGLEAPSSGLIAFDGADFAAASAFQRNIGMVFQSYALFPHLTVFENVAYGLRIRRLGGDEVRDRVARVLALLGLQDLAGRHPADLSGGQQQRVSIARALVYAPSMLLLDEPLANLDAKLRVEMREEIRRIQKSLGILSIYVTHDQEEAMSVSDRVAVLDRGRLQQIGPPAAIYADPATLFVADFIGKANFFPARRSGAGIALAGGGEISLPGRRHTVEPDEAGLIPPGADGLVMMRPEHLELRPAGAAPIAGTVQRVQFLGSFARYAVDTPASARPVLVDTVRPVTGLGEGDPASLAFGSEDAIFYERPPAL